jgi:mannose-6-phosphate isomerase-like protein (cupin superfamily)
MQLFSVDNAEHYVWGGQCDAWFLLKHERFHVIRERMPAGAKEVMHYHKNSTQLFYVLSGELAIVTESKVVRVPSGHALSVEPSTRHQALNESPDAVEFLVVSCPPSHGDRFDCE